MDRNATPAAVGVTLAVPTPPVSRSPPQQNAVPAAVIAQAWDSPTLMRTNDPPPTASGAGPKSAPQQSAAPVELSAHVLSVPALIAMNPEPAPRAIGSSE